jgi:hypothetical protein
MILKFELDRSTSDGSPADGDWWTLCYDTEQDAFYVDHEWDRSDPLHPGRHLKSGVRRYSNAASWRGPGNRKLASGIARLKDRARAQLGWGPESQVRSNPPSERGAFGEQEDGRPAPP